MHRVFDTQTLQKKKKNHTTNAALKRWNQERVGNIQENIRRLSLTLENLQKETTTIETSELEEYIHKTLLEEQRKEEML